MSSSGTTEAAPPLGKLASAEWALRASSARLWTIACIGLGVALSSPALQTGLVADDYLHALMLRDDPGMRGLAHRPFDLFRFASGDAEAARALIAEGVFPWWADPRAVLAFFRPLSSATHWLDHRLWPGAPVWMHLHSLVWFGLLTGVVAALYRRFAGAVHGLSIALLLFAIDDAHAPVVGWIANRNALIALSLSLPALLVHDRFRREGYARGVWLGPALLGLGLAAGEAAVGALAYLVAYAACLDPGRGASPWRALWPYAVVVAAWKLCCIALGYGALGSGLYVDPLADPLGFAAALGERFPVLALGLLGAPFADFWELYPLFSPWLRSGVVLLALLVLSAFALGLAPLLGRDARLQFWTLGTVLSLVPMCATFPHDRSLLAPSVGGMALVAALLEGGWARRARWRWALGTGALAMLHLVIAPALAPLRAGSVGRFDELLGASDATLPHGPEVRAQTVILLNPPLDPFAAYLPVYRESTGTPRPRQQLWLATGVTALTVTKLDEHSIAVRPDGGFLSSSMQAMLRDPERGFALGERVDLEGVSITVSERTVDRRPLEIVVRFERRLDDPRLVWRRWSNAGYAPFALPPVGGSSVLPRAELRELLFSS